MMLEFLKSYKHAVSLDDQRFDRYFLKGRADFTLFENRVICEVKDFQEINLAKQAERIRKRGDLYEKFVGVNVASPIRDELQDKAKQITQTKECLKLPRALGLIILENHRPADLSAVVLIEAADWELQRWLDDVDGVLCLDFTNHFTSEGEAIRLAQLVARPTRRGRKLSKIVGQLMGDFSRDRGVPLRTQYDLVSAQHAWQIDTDGKFRGYRAKIDFALRQAEETKWHRFLRFVAKWSWVIGLGVGLILWFAHRLGLIR
jgi:hypothetical protein